MSQHKSGLSGNEESAIEFYELRLYVVGKSENSLLAFKNLKEICEEYLQGRYTIEVIDLLENPRLAKDHQILAVPTLVRKLPEPIKKIIGNLANREKVLVGLDVKPIKSNSKNSYRK